MLKTAEELEAKGFVLGGMISKEICEGCVRVGFEIREYATDRRGWLAHIRRPVGPRIGKYRVNLNDLNSIGVSAILGALKTADVVLIDEIGPMEMLSSDFQNAVLKTIVSPKPLLGTIHWRLQHPLVAQIKSRSDAYVMRVDQENRVELPVAIAEKILPVVSSSIK